jgi:hypothetical protein
MAERKGRPSKYESRVKPYLKEIKEWRVVMTEEQIAETLGISYSSFRSYKNKYEELQQALEIGKRHLVADLMSTMIKLAKGYSYDEVEVIEDEKNGKTKKVKTRVQPPNVVAIDKLLKNLDPENWTDKPREVDLKEKEFQFQKEKFEKNEW